MNKQCDEVMCVVCTPDKYVNDFLKSKSKDFTNGKVLLALNVGQDKNLNQYSLLMESDKEIIGHS